jgi:hypothetical protein
MALTFSLLLEASLLVPIIFYLSQGIYNLYLHPLRSLPGPKTWVAFPLLRNISACLGLYDERMREFHNRYGNVVQKSPLSRLKPGRTYTVTDTDSCRRTFNNVAQTPDILNAGDADHTKFRKALSHGFSDRSLRAQEPIVKFYVDLLVQKLRELAVIDQSVDMVKWYNLTTFDIIGDLAFGESSGRSRDINLPHLGQNHV